MKLLSPRKMAELLNERQKLEQKYFGVDSQITQMPRNPFPMYQMVAIALASLKPFSTNAKQLTYEYWNETVQKRNVIFKIEGSNIEKTVELKRFEFHGFKNSTDAIEHFLKQHAMCINDFLSYGRANKWRLSANDLSARGFLYTSLCKAKKMYSEMCTTYELYGRLYYYLSE